MIDRSIAPPVFPVRDFELPEVKKHTLKNGLDVWYIENFTQPVVGVRLVFKAGKVCETTSGAASLTVQMLDKGTRTKSAAEIAEMLAYYGSALQLTSQTDRSQIGLSTISRFLPDILPLLTELLTEPTFDDKEFEILKNQTRQNLLVSLQQTGTQANRAFKNALFGNEHPYGHTITPEEIDSISIEAVKEHFNDFYKGKSFDIFLCGAITTEVLSQIEQCFGSLQVETASQKEVIVSNGLKGSATIPVAVSGSSQNTIFIGKRMFTKTHPDYHKMKLLCKILGGYFGSRLMQNIREDKGLTYGISSFIVSMENDGFFAIHADVNADLTEQAIQEIFNEMNALADAEVSSEELDMVLNFMTGSFISSLQTPFDAIGKFISIQPFGFTMDYYNNAFQEYYQTTAKELLELAAKYFKTNDFLTVIAGKV